MPLPNPTKIRYLWYTYRLLWQKRDKRLMMLQSLGRRSNVHHRDTLETAGQGDRGTVIQQIEETETLWDMGQIQGKRDIRWNFLIYNIFSGQLSKPVLITFQSQWIVALVYPKTVMIQVIISVRYQNNRSLVFNL